MVQASPKAGLIGGDDGALQCLLQSIDNADTAKAGACDQYGIGGGGTRGNDLLQQDVRCSMCMNARYSSS